MSSEHKNIRQVDFNRPWYGFALETIDDFSLDGKFICDIGCGAGEISRLLSEDGATITCLDGDSNNVKRAREQGFDATVVNLEQGVPLETDHYDLVVMLEVIEHICKAEKLLFEVARILKPGGYLLISTPNIGFPLYRVRFLLTAALFMEGVHFRFFNKNSFQHILNDSGFKIIRKNSLCPWIGINSILKPFGWHRSFFKVPDFLESLLALNFVWLLRNKSNIDSTKE